MFYWLSAELTCSRSDRKHGEHIPELTRDADQGPIRCLKKMYKVAGFQESILSREHINIAAMNCLHCPARHGTNSTCCLPHLAWPLPTGQRQSEGVGRALEQLENLGPRPGNFQLPGRASLANALTSLRIRFGNSQHSSDLHMGDCKYQMGQ